MTLDEIRRNVEYNTASISDFGQVVLIVKKIKKLQEELIPFIDGLSKNNNFFNALSLEEKNFIVLATKIKDLTKSDLE